MQPVTQHLSTPVEENKDGHFSSTAHKKYYNKKWRRSKGKQPSTSLGKERIMAIYVYSLDKPKVYLDFNKAVQSQKSEYKTTFRYHALHFVLTKAIRFDSFTSASMGWYPSSERFGDESCFEIVLCHGADVSLFSKLGEAEREALIPPYEVFKVTSVKRRSEQKNLPCEVVYKLKSTRKTLSSLNCALF
ncbi:ecto-ADP-ribosyltransferase 5-like [Labrus mixtus]|uniref:ecto-ADP-ribosyltransferase 5-like n=1 Tax=Labrus mixtus TaxID=508554 RepID=UPI0029C0CB5F|nr:ecto-ADP-ribosyltransferase 5-like [Labrus mixtus]